MEHKSCWLLLRLGALVLLGQLGPTASTICWGGMGTRGHVEAWSFLGALILHSLDPMSLFSLIIQTGTCSGP